MYKECRNCHYYEDFQGVCFNGESEDCCEFTDPGHSCPHWSMKKKVRQRGEAMTEAEVDRVKKKGLAISKLEAEGRQQGLSYGQLQAQRYEQQQKLAAAQVKVAKELEKPKTEKGPNGRPRKVMPEGFEQIAQMILNGEISKNRVSINIGIAPLTIQRWIDELVRNGVIR